MEFADTESFDCLSMFSCPVTFVFGKVILRILLMTFHHPVPGHLGHDRGGSNGVAQLVAFWDRFLWDGKSEALGTINEEKIRRNRKVSNGQGHGL